MFLCWGQRSISGVFLGFSPTYFLRQCLLLNLSSPMQLSCLADGLQGSCPQLPSHGVVAMGPQTHAITPAFTRVLGVLSGFSGEGTFLTEPPKNVFSWVALQTFCRKSTRLADQRLGVWAIALWRVGWRQDFVIPACARSLGCVVSRRSDIPPPQTQTEFHFTSGSPLQRKISSRGSGTRLLCHDLWWHQVSHKLRSLSQWPHHFLVFKSSKIIMDLLFGEEKILGVWTNPLSGKMILSCWSKLTLQFGLF